MARPTRSDMQKYETVLTEIGERLRLVRQLLAQPVTQVEWIAVELRIALELIVLGCQSLVTPGRGLRWVARGDVDPPAGAVRRSVSMVGVSDIG